MSRVLPLKHGSRLAYLQMLLLLLLLVQCSRYCLIASGIFTTLISPSTRIRFLLLSWKPGGRLRRLRFDVNIIYFFPFKRHECPDSACDMATRMRNAWNKAHEKVAFFLHLATCCRGCLWSRVSHAFSRRRQLRVRVGSCSNFFL